MTESVAFVTYREQPELTPDDRLAADAFSTLTGIQVTALPWDQKERDWSNFSAIVLRSMWDYFHRPVEFKQWLSEMEKCQTRVFNSPALARWNMEKTYIRDLESLNMFAVPTLWVQRDDTRFLAQILKEREWDKIVIKPTISGSAYETWITTPEIATSPSEQSRFERLVRKGGVMIQPFMEEITAVGEWSLIFIDGEFSHSIIKTPAPGDFRVQAQFGASRKRARPSSSLLEQAFRLLETATAVTGENMPLYARVDGIETGMDGAFLLMELELIEPVLSFAADPDEAPRRFAEALASRINLP